MPQINTSSQTRLRDRIIMTKIRQKIDKLGLFRMQANRLHDNVMPGLMVFCKMICLILSAFRRITVLDEAKSDNPGLSFAESLVLYIRVFQRLNPRSGRSTMNSSRPN